MKAPSVLKVGTRGSALALTQSRQVIALLEKKFPRVRFEVVVIKTSGDKITDVPLSRIGLKGLFIKEIEEALLKRRVDIAIHSLKDLPTEFPKGLGLGAVLKREDPRDCLISARRYNLKSLPRGARVGTSSLRRQAQILALRPDLKVLDLRGNLDTRVRKLKEGHYDAIVVARAGVKRLWGNVRPESLRLRPISPSEILPAVGQGALAIEVRSADKNAGKIAKALHHPATHRSVLCERAFMKRLEGGCQVPVGVVTLIQNGNIRLRGLVASPDGKKTVAGVLSGPQGSAEEIGTRLAEKLLKAGAGAILDGIRN